MSVKLVRLEAQQAEILRILQDERAERKTTNSRLTALETKINYAAGAVAIISLFFGTVISLIKEKLFQ